MSSSGLIPVGKFRVPLSLRDVSKQELGAGVLITPESLLAALTIPQRGEMFDLDPGRFNGMPRDPLSPPFHVVSHRTPHGVRAEGDIDFLRPEVNPTGTAWIDELVIGTIHCGAHMDALCHVTRGDRGEWYGGFTADKDLGDFGPLKADASKLPPIITRGVLLDIPRAKNLPELPAGYEIQASDLRDALHKQGVELRDGDVVLIRTGLMQHWPDDISWERKQPGIVPDAARFLTGYNPVAVGCDTSGLEAHEEPDGLPNAVHIHLLIEHGVYIFEWLYLEELARAEEYEFLFLCLPLKIQGATGSWVRPVCIV
jgi:kynurenine formamidase